MSGQDGFERVAQKQRTRQALLIAAGELLEAGQQPTVPGAADRAGISRATAYRYFSTPESLAHEAALDLVARRFEAASMPALPADASLQDRADLVVQAVLGMVLENEALFRAFLAAANHDPSRPAPRGGRRLRWIREALAPAAGQAPPRNFETMVDGLALLTGIETLIVLADVCGHDRGRVITRARAVARMLVAGLSTS